MFAKEAGTRFEHERLRDPDIAKIGDSKFRQFYCSDPVIKSAVTSDGLTFVDDSGVRLTSDENNKIICDPAPIETKAE